MPIAYSYLRFSSSAQAHGESLNRQARAAQDWIAANPQYKLMLEQASLIDAGLSAWAGNHVQEGAFGKFLELVRCGSVPAGSWLIVEALDRLSRQNPWAAQHQLSGLVLAGITVVTCIDGKIYNQNSDIGSMIISLVAMSEAHKSSEDKSVRIRATKSKRVTEAQAGTALTAQCPRWLSLEPVSSGNRLTRKYDIIESRAATIRLIYELGLIHGFNKVTQILIKRNVETFGHTGKWSAQYVRLILRSSAPIGHRQSLHGLIENEFPAIMDVDLWQRVQDAQSRRYRGSGLRENAFINILSGLVKCAQCKNSMRVNAGRYYQCRRSVSGGCSHKKLYHIERIEDAIRDNFDILRVGALPRNIDVSVLIAKRDELKEAEKRLAGRMARVTDDSIFDALLSELGVIQAELRAAVAEIASAEKVPTQVAQLGSLTDRAQMAAACRSIIGKVWFHEGDEDILVVALNERLVLHVPVSGQESAWVDYSYV